MIVESWGVKDHCVLCGLPCRRTLCPHYAAGYTLECDVCCETWDVKADAPELDDDDHVCDACASAAKELNPEE